MADATPGIHYTDAARGAAHVQKDEKLVQDGWLDQVDDLIDQYMGYGYKGRTQTVLVQGSGRNKLLKLPRLAATITSVTDELGNVVAADTYVLEPRGRILRRKNTTQYTPYLPSNLAVWAESLYTVVLVEPPVEAAPALWQMAATHCIGHLILWSDKYAEFGIALTASDAGQAGKVASSEAISFPASLQEDLRRIIQTLLVRPII